MTIFHASIETIPTLNSSTEIVRLAKEVRDTLWQGGHVLMPCFALGRTQDLVLTLALLKDEGEIPHNTQILYHSGLTTKINEIYH